MNIYFFLLIYIFVSITFDYLCTTFYSMRFSKMFRCLTVCKFRALLISDVKIKLIISRLDLYNTLSARSFVRSFEQDLSL